MPFGDIAGEIVGGIFRFLGQILLEIVLEILIKGPGHFICGKFSRNIDPEGVMVVFAGFMFWGVIGGCGYGIYKFVLT